MWGFFIIFVFIVMRDLIRQYIRETAHNKLNLNTFIVRSKESHGDKYDYSLVDYKNQ